MQIPVYRGPGEKHPQDRPARIGSAIEETPDRTGRHAAQADLRARHPSPSRRGARNQAAP
ncbi:MAG: hypothetical protein ABI790_12265 [Betaproteobacteria bacterium]